MMTPAYSVINNPQLTSLTTAPSPRRVERGDALTLITGRQFHVLGDMVLHSLDHVGAYTGGIFVTGVRADKRINTLRGLYPSIPMIVEPSAIRDYWATETEPFFVESADLLFPATINGTLDRQIFRSSDIAVTPTGQIRTGDSATLKAALIAANALSRRDILFALPLEAGWLSDDLLVNQIIAVIDRSVHPVLLMFSDRINPLASAKRQKSYIRIFQNTTGVVVAYRTDMTGLAARAFGAVATAVGAYPSVRRLNPVGKHGFASDKTDLSPHVLVGDMMRFVRSSHMRDQWFAAVPSFQCFCDICRGDSIDRLYGSNDDRVTGHLHNIVESERFHALTLGRTPSQMETLWRRLVAGAIDTYPQLETHIGAKVQIPADLLLWSKL